VIIPIRVKVGTNYNATAGASQWSRFQCMHCGYERNVLLVGFGTGSGFDLLSLDPSGAAQRSLTRAQRKAARACRQSIAVARCPHCQRADTRARRRVVITSILLGLGFGVTMAAGGAMLVLGGLKLDPTKETWMLPVAIVVALVIGIGSSWSRIMRRLAQPFFAEEDAESLRAVTAPPQAGTANNVIPGARVVRRDPQTRDGSGA
jgi:hypothetical protein